MEFQRLYKLLNEKNLFVVLMDQRPEEKEGVEVVGQVDSEQKHRVNILGNVAKLDELYAMVDKFAETKGFNHDKNAKKILTELVKTYVPSKKLNKFFDIITNKPYEILKTKEGHLVDVMKPLEDILDSKEIEIIKAFMLQSDTAKTSGTVARGPGELYMLFFTELKSPPKGESGDLRTPDGKNVELKGTSAQMTVGGKGGATPQGVANALIYLKDKFHKINVDKFEGTDPFFIISDSLFDSLATKAKGESYATTAVIFEEIYGQLKLLKSYMKEIGSEDLYDNVIKGLPALLRQYKDVPGTEESNVQAAEVLDNLITAANESVNVQDDPKLLASLKAIEDNIKALEKEASSKIGKAKDLAKQAVIQANYDKKKADKKIRYDAVAQKMLLAKDKSKKEFDAGIFQKFEYLIAALHIDTYDKITKSEYDILFNNSDPTPGKDDYVVHKTGGSFEELIEMLEKYDTKLDLQWKPTPGERKGIGFMLTSKYKMTDAERDKLEDLMKP